MQKAESGHPRYALEPDLGEAVGKRNSTEDVQEPNHLPTNNRAGLLALAERLQWDFPQVANILQALCAEGTDALIADLYAHLAAFPRSVEPLAKENAAFPVCAHCGEPLDVGVVTSAGPQYHGRCLRESYRLAATDVDDPESIR